MTDAATPLEKIAIAMQSVAQATGQAQHRLGRGLILTLWRDGGDWVLSLTRSGVPPGDQELETCRQAFDIPAEAQVEPEAKPINGYHVTRLRWSEKAPAQGPEQLSFGGQAVPPPPNPYNYD